MAAVCAANGGDMRCVAGVRQPVVNCGTNAPALDRGIAGPVVPGDQQENSIPRGNGLLQRSVDRQPRRIEVHSVKIEDVVRLDRAAAQAFVPAAIEGSMLEWRWWR